MSGTKLTNEKQKEIDKNIHVISTSYLFGTVISVYEVKKII